MNGPAASASQVLSLPKGGGAVHGIGETFQPDLFTGTGNFTIPITSSPGREGFGPSLSLQYSSGHGNSVFGLGWRLSLPCIARKTEKGLPRFDDHDVFVLSGAEDLVAQLKSGSLDPDIVRRGGFTIRRFRPRTEGLFARIEQWTDDANHDVHWRATTKENITSLYGRTAEARVADPTAPQRVYQWLLQETFDARGNHILYEYAREEGDGSPRAIYEANRSYSQLYLRRVYYGNSAQPVGPARAGTDHRSPLALTDRHYLFELVFDYGDLPRVPGDPYAARGPALQETVSGWPVRPDPFSTFRAGFEVRTLRRCERALMFHHFTELGGPTLVRSTDFGYDTDPLTRVSLLKSVTAVAYRREAGGYVAAGMPPVSFAYSEFKPHEQRYQPVRARGGDLPPLGLNSPDFALVDLTGDGLPDVLQTGVAGFRYWRNRGQGLLDRPYLMETGVPAGLTLSQPGVAFADLAGDGQADLLVTSGPLHGFFETTPEGTWSTFTPLEASPSFDLGDPSVRQLDLTGDGLPDILMTRDHHFLWFESLGEKGFAEPRYTERVHDLNEFPDVYFDDPSGRVRLADMTGDGLNDIVLLHDGRIDYWPNLGYGRFGKRITMANAPRFEYPFDPKRLFLADLDGSGCADLVYVDFDRVHFWLNQCGNGWSEPQTIHGTPVTTNADAVQFCDFFGTGTATLLWSKDFTPQPGGNYRALDFCGGVKPHLLVEMNNNRGATTRVRYVPSTKYYLADEAAGTPWATRLPFPVHVLEKVETIDHVGKTKLVTTYSYHHGYFDGREREFRGFGRVDRCDTEEFARFQQADLHDDGRFDNGRPAHYVAPVLTRTWFHSGAYFDRQPLWDRYRAEFYAGDSRALNLGDSVVPAGDAPWDACRALRGKILRTEVFACDGTPLEAEPYTVTENRYRVQQLQPAADGAHAVFLTTPLESVTFHYERSPNDPRVAHQVNLAVDDFGNITDSVAIAYPRRTPAFPEQQALQVVYRQTDFINTADRVGFYLAGIPYQDRKYEVTGIPWSWGDGRWLSDQDFTALLDGSLIPRPYEWDRPPGQTGIEQRILEWTRTYFRTDTDPEVLDPVGRLDHRLPLGEVESLALPYERYQAAFTDDLLDDVYQGRIAADLPDEGGYHEEADAPGYWWIPSGRQAFHPDRFFLSHLSQDPFGSRTTTTHDRYALLMEEVTDPLGNRVRVLRQTADPFGNPVAGGNDYRVLQAALIEDANGNRAQVAFNIFGLVVGTARMGKVGDGVGDSLYAFDPDPDDATLQAYLADPLDDPAALLGRATTRLIYDLHAYERDGTPNVVATLARETHASELGGDQPNIQHRFLYSDGLGRAIQTKVQAEPGPVAGMAASPHWLGTGWTILNNKGQPVQKYEPFFSTTHAFDFAVRQGFSASLFYDPPGRVVATLHPNGTYEKVLFDPWQQTHWDVNDTVGLDPRTDADVQTPAGASLAALPTGWQTWLQQRISPAGLAHPPSRPTPNQDAALKAYAHRATPAVLHLDNLGRVFRTVADNGPDGRFATHIALDIQGHDRASTDPRGVSAFEHRFDLAGRKLAVDSADAGLRLALPDVLGNVLHTVDAEGNYVRTRYDRLRRPEEIWVAAAGNPEYLAQKTIYGELLPSPKTSNHRGQVFRVYDGAGVVTNELYDFKGNLQAISRVLARDYRAAVPWDRLIGSTDPAVIAARAAPQLESEVFYSLTGYDALNRITSHVAPDGSVHRPVYNEANLLAALTVRLAGETTERAFVAGVAYNEKGQRIRIEYGNGVTTTYDYDRLTFRLTRLQSRRANGDWLQDMTYTHDPVGNVTRVEDATAATVFNHNQRIDGVSLYTYDPLYRLRQAQGREHGAMTACHYSHGDQKQTEFIPLTPQPINNGRDLYQYLERYTYDPAGNLERVQHASGSGTSWTRTQTFQPDCNRLATSNASCPGDGPVRHDANGNIVALPHLPALTWNHANQLCSADLGITTQGVPDMAYYTYDATGARVRSVVERGARRYERIYLGHFEVYREYAGGTRRFERTTLHVMDDQRRIALVESWEENGRQMTRLRYQLADHLASSVLEVTEAPSADLISLEEYYPYGGTAYVAGASQTEVQEKRFRYSGKERDDATGLYYFGARYYAEWLGRWLSCDPSASLNRFVFASNNPIKLIDPDGRREASAEEQFFSGYVVGAAEIVYGSAKEVGHFGVDVATGLLVNALGDEETKEAWASGEGFQSGISRLVAGRSAEPVIEGIKAMPDRWSEAMLESATASHEGDYFAAGRAFAAPAMALVTLADSAVASGGLLRRASSYGKLEAAIGRMTAAEAEYAYIANAELREMLVTLRMQGAQLKGKYVAITQQDPQYQSALQHGGAYHQLTGPSGGTTYVIMDKIRQGVFDPQFGTTFTAEQVLMHESGHFRQKPPTATGALERAQYYANEARASRTAARSAPTRTDKKVLLDHAEKNATQARKLKKLAK